ncbi:hypothetical protein BH11PSE2_BH11PSE2_17600 [soil metagenome]
MDAFEEVLGWDPDTVPIRLTERYGDDPVLLAAVQALLRADANRGMIPTSPPERMAGDADGEAEQAAPERLGVYRLTELIGRGGMGLVYRGERADGLFDQTVAIKLVRAGLFTAAAAEQFKIERKILAKLRHPHIAQLFDGGVSDTGASYFIMELIHGEPITKYADAHSLNLRQRLALFLEASGAVQYAHQQLVVHADIKPSNIVVEDGYGVKLLDFGIGRLLESEDADSPALAQTPGYSSPQQASGERPTPADDIYSLGVVLKDLSIGHEGVDDDLLAIIAKANQSAVEDRYATVGELSADVERWLRSEPVTARPPSRRRGLLLLWRRHRLAATLAAVGLTGLIATASITTVLYLQAEAARRQAEQRFTEVRTLSRFMLNDVTDALERFPGATKLRRDLADHGRDFLENLSHVPGASPDLRLEAAQGYAKTGEILANSAVQNLGDPVAGKAALLKAEQELRKLLAETPKRDDIALTLARTLIVRGGIVATADNDSKLGLKLEDEAASMIDGIIARQPGNGEARLMRWRGDVVKANILNNEGRFADMVPLLETALARGRAMPAELDPRQARPLLEVSTQNLLGDARYYLNDQNGALAAYVAAAKVLETARDGGVPDIRIYDRLAVTDYNIASTLNEMSRRPESLAWIDKGVEAVTRMRAFEDSPRARHVENMVRLQRAVTLSEMHRYDEAIAEARTNMDARKARAAAAPKDYEAARAVAVGLRPVGEIYWDAGRRPESCAIFREARDVWQSLKRSGGLAEFDKSDETVRVDKYLQRCAQLKVH